MSTVIYPNVTDQVHCLMCCDDGVLPVAVEIRRPPRQPKDGQEFTYKEEVYGPCPVCEKGHRTEFPDNGWGPWGKDGYWKGRAWNDLVSTCRCKEKPMSAKEAREESKRLTELSARTAVTLARTDRPVTPPEQPRDALDDAGATPAPTDDASDSTGPVASDETEAPDETATPNRSGASPEGNDGASGAAEPSDSTSSPDGDTVAESPAASHYCPTSTREVPWSKSECAACTPYPSAGEDVIPF